MAKKARLHSPKKARLDTDEEDMFDASGKGLCGKVVDDLGKDPHAASSDGKGVGPTSDDRHVPLDILSDDSGSPSGGASSDFSSISADRGHRDPELLPALSKRAQLFSEGRKASALTMSQMADRLELDGVKRKAFRDAAYKAARSQKKKASSAESTSSALASLSAAYNKGMLRIGEMADPDHEQRKKVRGYRVHPKAWTISGTIEVAFSSVGVLHQGHRGLAATTRPLDAFAAVALAAIDFQREALRAWSKFFMPASGRCKWVCMTRSHDSTPLKIRFGMLKELQQVARYWHKTGKIGGSQKTGLEARAQLLTFDELKQRTKALPSYGITELMVQRGCFAWPERRGDFVVQQSKNIFFPPKFLARTNGSTIFACMQAAGAGSSLEQFFEMSSFVDFLVVFVGSDLASSCGRAKQEVLFRCKQHNEGAVQAGQGVVLLIQGDCAAHIVHREVEGHFKTQELIPRLYNTAWSSSLPGMYAKMLACLEKMVAADLQHGFTLASSHLPSNAGSTRWSWRRRRSCGPSM